MTKVEFFESEDLYKLKQKVNKYLKDIPHKNIVKIYYNKVLFGQSSSGPIFSYSVMIVTDGPLEESMFEAGKLRIGFDPNLE